MLTVTRASAPPFGLGAHTWAALQTFIAGLQLAAGQSIKDSGGAARYTPATATPHNKLTGDLHLFGNPTQMRIGPLAPAGGGILEVNAGTAAGGGVNLIKAGHAGSGINLTTGTVRGVFGQPIVILNAAFDTGAVYGLQFQPIIGGGGSGKTLPSLIGTYTGWGALNYLGAITEAVGINVVQPYTSGASWSAATSIGVRIANTAPSNRITDAYGLYIADITLATGVKRLIEAMGATTTNLRLEAGDPAADASQLLIAVNNGAVVPRRVEIGAADSGGAGYRMLRVLN